MIHEHVAGNDHADYFDIVARVDVDDVTDVGVDDLYDDVADVSADVGGGVDDDAHVADDDVAVAVAVPQSSIDPAEDVDLTGLIESTVDSDEDEEDLMATMDSINPR